MTENFIPYPTGMTENVSFFFRSLIFLERDRGVLTPGMTTGVTVERHALVAAAHK